MESRRTVTNSIEQNVGESPALICWRIEGQLDGDRLRIHCLSRLKRLLGDVSFTPHSPQCGPANESHADPKTDQVTWEEHNCVALSVEDRQNWLAAVAENMRVDGLTSNSTPQVHCAMVRTEPESSEIFIAFHPLPLPGVNWLKVIEEISCLYNGCSLEVHSDATSEGCRTSGGSFELASRLDDQGRLGKLPRPEIDASNPAVSPSRASIQPYQANSETGNSGKAENQRQEKEDIQRRLTEIWESLLGVHPVQKSDDFFELGGHSLLVAKLLSRIKLAFQKDLSPAILLTASTVEKQARLICSRDVPGNIQTIRSGATENQAAMVFMGGDPTFLPLSKLLSRKFDFHSFGLTRSVFEEVSDPHSLRAIADYFAAQIAEFAGNRPLLLAGWCAQGVLAMEIARRLRAQGFNVGSVILLQTSNPAELAKYPNWKRAISRNQLKWHLLVFELAYLKYLGAKRGWRYFVARVLDQIQSPRTLAGENAGAESPATDVSLVRDFDEHVETAVEGFRPLPYDGKVLLIRGQKKTFGFASKPDLGWAGLLPKLKIQEVPGNHFTIYMHPNAQDLVSAIEEYWSQVKEPLPEA